jgi:hypothetical protein
MFSSVGVEKRTWLIKLPRGIDYYEWGEGGEEGVESGRSVKSERIEKRVTGAVLICH